MRIVTNISAHKTKNFIKKNEKKINKNSKEIQQSKCHKYLQIVEQNLQYTGS